MPSTSPSTDACPPDESRTTTTSYTVKLTDPWARGAGGRASDRDVSSGQVRPSVGYGAMRQCNSIIGAAGSVGIRR